MFQSVEFCYELSRKSNIRAVWRLLSNGLPVEAPQLLRAGGELKGTSLAEVGERAPIYT